MTLTWMVIAFAAIALIAIYACTQGK